MTDVFSPPPRPGTPRYVGHRGFTPLAPENSLPAFEFSSAMGHWAIETDVRLTRDGVLVCCHDARVDRTFDGEGPVEELTWAQIAQMRMDTGSRLQTFHPDELRMPRFSEYLTLCASRGAVPFIELKVPEVERVMRAVREAGLGEHQVVMSSSHREWIEAARAVAPGVYIHHIFSSQEHMQPLADLGNAGMAWNVPEPAAFDPAEVARAHAMGLKVCLRAGDSVRQVQQMLDLGLDYIPTNVMHAQRRSHSGLFA